jgi:hypothetical protein
LPLVGTFADPHVARAGMHASPAVHQDITEIRMNRHRVKSRIGLLLGLSLATAATFAATPPPNYSNRVYLCEGRLFADVKITFSQSATTAAVHAESKPLKVNPYSPGGYTPYQSYTIQATAAVKKDAATAWSAITNTGQGVAGVTQEPVSSGNSTFKDTTCEIKGSVRILTLCPPQSIIGADGALIERNWVGCGT